MSIPKKYQDLVGTKQTLGGGLFSGKKESPQKDYNIIGIRWGSATVVNFQEFSKTCESSYEHPTIELLVKSDDMKKSRWTRGFKVKEIDLKKESV